MGASRQVVFAVVLATAVWLLAVASSLRPSRSVPIPPRATPRKVWAPIDRHPEGSEGESAGEDSGGTAHDSGGAADHADNGAGDAIRHSGGAEDASSGEEAEGGGAEGAANGEKLPPGAELILQPPLDLDDTSVRDACKADFQFRDDDRNAAYMRKFGAIFKRLKVHWWLDEGGLIGASRAGSMINADDDFDFFALLPNQIHPCRPDSHTCDDPKEFSDMIHGFLSEFWKEGMCVNNYHPDKNKYNASRKLMYSFMLDRNRIYQPHAKTPGARCFEHGKTPQFAHMHLGILTDDGKLATNVWAPPLSKGGHAHDKIPLTTVLPVRRCRAGAVDAPCPNNIEAFLKMRNEGEYGRASSQGSCLLVRRKWGLKRKQDVVQATKDLHKCGYNSMYSMVAAAERSGYSNC